MKTIRTIAGIVLIASIAILHSCSTRSVSMQVLVPAAITIPQDINSIAILNRSLPGKDAEFINVLEGFITGESVMADREGSFNCIRGVESRVNTSPRLKAFALETDTYRGTGTRQFPEQLDWETVNSLCAQYKVDAILALETFDSDFSLHKNTSKYKTKVNGREVEKTEYHAKLRVNVNSGWRLYDNIHRKLIDQVNFADSKEWEGTGDNEKAALNNLPSKRHTINESGNYSGIRIADRITPNWHTVNRPYFVRGKEFKDAKKQVKYRNWDAAIASWKELTRNADPKIAGRACFNMAVAAEQKGDIEAAISWADKAMKEYHIGKARHYSDELYKRKSDELLLKEQMK
ncbi:MAG: tetratricopeptide repeat protein [Bacteroidetes bacterium]|nr:tetratricopeptide repeat protein [Bacteroidota bacterium]